MNTKEIEKKTKELKSILLQYQTELGSIENELFRTVSDYQKALEEEKLKEIRSSLQ